ncbi:hypothetical protein [Shewanella sp. 0m-4]
MLAFMQKNTSRPRLLIAAIVLTGLLAISVFFAIKDRQSPQLAPGSILILPVSVELNALELDSLELNSPELDSLELNALELDSLELNSPELESDNNDWQAYAQMEQVILALGTSAQYPVLQVEDVISMLSQAESYIQDPEPIDLNRLFTLSGSSLIVESSLSLEAKQYRLQYRFLSAKKVITGSIKGASISAVQKELAERIQDFAGQPFSQNAQRQQAWFSNPQLINALEQIQYAQLDDAQSSLNELLAQSPNNLIAIRRLAELIMAQSEELDDKGAQEKLAISKQWLDRGISAANDTNNQRQLARLKFALAQNKLKNGELELAISELSQARILAANTQDWLYLGYISNWSGHIYQRLNRYKNANAQYQLSFDYQQKVGYPAGQVAALNNLAKLQMLQHNYSLAYKAIKQSVAIVTQRDLSQLREPTFTLLAQIEDKL